MSTLMAHQTRAPVPVTILTGFLGAGKTTLLNRLLGDPALKDVAVIINEFGDVSLDHLFVERSDDDVIELASGCLCCTVRGELVETLERLLMRSVQDEDGKEIAGIVIETTGLADPVPVMQAVMAHPALRGHITLSRVVTLVDAVNGLSTVRTHEEARRQVALADQILLTKTDLAADTGELKDAIERLNPATRFSLVADFSGDALFDSGFSFEAFAADAKQWFHDEHDHDHGHDHGHHGHDHNHHDHDHHHHHDATRHSDTVRSFSLVQESAVSAGGLLMFLELLASAHGPSLLRVKGLVKVADHPERPVLIHGVQTVFHPPEYLDAWPDEDERTRIVFITDGLDASFVERLFAAFSKEPQIDGPDEAALTDNPLAISGFKPG